MTARKSQLIRAFMGVLKDNDGTPASEASIQFDMTLLVAPDPTMAEVADAVKFCQTRGWCDGTTTELGSQFWAITTKGKVAELR